MAHFGLLILLTLDLSHLEMTLSDQVVALQPRGHRLTRTFPVGEQSPSKFLETIVAKAPDTFSVAQGTPKSEAPTGQ